MRIEIIQAAHYETLREFFRRNNRREITDWFYPFPLTEDIARRICFEPRQDIYYLGYVGQKPVVFGCLRGWDEGFDVPCFGMFADFEFIGRGYGVALMAHALAEAKELGCPGVIARVHNDNLSVHRICKHFGMVGHEHNGRIRYEVHFESSAVTA